jgi:FkbM family methyltransferase
LLSKVKIFNRLDIPQRLRDFTLLRTLNGTDWFPFFTKADVTIFQEYTAEIHQEVIAKCVRLRLDGHGFLHFRECQIFGAQPDRETRERLVAAEQEALAVRKAIPADRKGYISRIGDFYVFVDEDRYPKRIRDTIDHGLVEIRERQSVENFVKPGDRVIEAGSGIGLVSMTAASIVGARNVATFDGNPDIVADAKANFIRNGFDGLEAICGVLMNAQRYHGGSVDFYVSREYWVSRLDSSVNAPDFVKLVKVPTFCLEEEIRLRDANVLICDIEGGEVDLVTDADLRGIRLIIMETHYWAAGHDETNRMVRKLIQHGFNIDLGASGGHVSIFVR